MAHGIKLDILSMEDLQSLIADAQKALASKVETERSELLKKLSALDAISKPAKVPERQRSAAKPTHRLPNGSEWSGRGGIPRSFKEYGIETKADAEKYRITE